METTLAARFRIKQTLPLLVVLIVVTLAVRHSSRLSDPPLTADFRACTIDGITILFPRGPSEGTVVTLKGEGVIFQYIDGGRSDNRLSPEFDKGTFSLSQDTLTLYRDGDDEGIMLALSAAEENDEYTYYLHGGGLLVGFAPANSWAKEVKHP